MAFSARFDLEKVTLFVEWEIVQGHIWLASVRRVETDVEIWIIPHVRPFQSPECSLIKFSFDDYILTSFITSSSGPGRELKLGGPLGPFMRGHKIENFMRKFF